MTKTLTEPKKKKRFADSILRAVERLKLQEGVE